MLVCVTLDPPLLAVRFTGPWGSEVAEEGEPFARYLWVRWLGEH